MRAAALAILCAALAARGVTAYFSNPVQLWLCAKGTPATHSWSQPAVAPSASVVSLPSGAALAGNSSYATQWVLLQANPGGVNASLFSHNPSGTISGLFGAATLCIEPAYSQLVFHGAQLRLGTCNASAAQSFTWHPEDGTLRPVVNGSLCLDYGSGVTCEGNPAAYCDPKASPAHRAYDLASRLETVELANMLFAAEIVEAYYGSNEGLPEWGLPPLWSGECLHGAVATCGAPYTDPATGYTSSGCATSFPAGLAAGGSLNRTAWAMLGYAIGDEVRGMNGQGLHGLSCWAPNVNPFRDPRWGRGHEVAGEDAGCVLSEYAAVFTYALQIGETDLGQLKTFATCKHETGYDS